MIMRQFSEETKKRMSEAAKRRALRSDGIWNRNIDKNSEEYVRWKTNVIEGNRQYYQTEGEENVS